VRGIGLFAAPANQIVPVPIGIDDALGLTVGLTAASMPP
jgi:hypothetical protein